MTVWDLNREQINELKQTYACQLRDCGEDKEVMGISYAELVDASLIPDEEINEENIIVSPLNKRVASEVSKAVIEVAKKTGVARI